MINDKTTQNMIRAKIAGEFRRRVPSLTPGNPVSAPDGRVLTYASCSTTYDGREGAHVVVRCYPITASALASGNPVNIPTVFRSAYLRRGVTVNVVEIDRPKTEPQRRSFSW